MAFAWMAKTPVQEEAHERDPVPDAEQSRTPRRWPNNWPDMRPKHVAQVIYDDEYMAEQSDKLRVRGPMPRRRVSPARRASCGVLSLRPW